MADTKTKKRGKGENRYSGTDTANWKVAYPASAIPDKKDGSTYPGFAQANAEARRFIEATGLYAAAVRS